MLVATGSTPLTAALYGFLQLKGDKMNKTRMVSLVSQPLHGRVWCNCVTSVVAENVILCNVFVVQYVVVGSSIQYTLVAMVTYYIYSVACLPW